MRELIPGLTLDIDTDRLAARIALVANIEGVDAATIVAALEGEGIARTSLDEDEIAAAVAKARAGEASEAVVAQGTPVHHGRDARVDIAPALAAAHDRAGGVVGKQPEGQGPPADLHHPPPGRVALCPPRAHPF